MTSPQMVVQQWNSPQNNLILAKLEVGKILQFTQMILDIGGVSHRASHKTIFFTWTLIQQVR